MLKRTVRVLPEVVPGGETGGNVDRTIEKALNRKQPPAPAVTNVTNITNPIAGISSLAGLAGAVTVSGSDNVVVSVAGSNLNFDGRIGPRFGFQWPAAGANISLGDGDYSIYGTSAQHCNNVTFPLASSMPGKIVRFTYPPGGSLIATGSDTIDAYANSTAEYQSDGVSSWKRVWSV